MLMSAELKECACDLYIFLIFLRSGITAPSFITVGYVWRILGAPHPWAAPRKLILNRVKADTISNPFSITFILKLTAISIWFNLDTIITVWRTSIFPSDMIMISYFDVTLNINFLANPALIRVFKIFIVLFSYHKFFVKMFFHHFTTALAFRNRVINKVTNSIFTQVWLKRLTKFIISTY